MIEYFDTYVRTDDGFLAVKGDFVCICRRNGIGGSYSAVFYRNRHPRTVAVALGGRIRWCQEMAVKRMKVLNDTGDSHDSN